MLIASDGTDTGSTAVGTAVVSDTGGETPIRWGFCSTKDVAAGVGVAVGTGAGVVVGVARGVKVAVGPGVGVGVQVGITVGGAGLGEMVMISVGLGTVDASVGRISVGPELQLARGSERIATRPTTVHVTILDR
jgi:hypothetical protein